MKIDMALQPFLRISDISLITIRLTVLQLKPAVRRTDMICAVCIQFMHKINIWS
jgi:hypothetical protein